MSFKKWIGEKYLKLRGWTVVGDIPPEEKKCMIIEAPHTCIEDFLIGLGFFWAREKKVKFLMKKEFFKTPVLRWILKRVGGIPVDRSRGNNMVAKTAAVFRQYEELYIVICPEGTRKRVERWKRGFYYIAEIAKVPVVMGFIDYKTKTCGYGPLFYPSGDYDEDWKMIEGFYRGMQGKTKGKFNLE
ncbi:MAG: 1-acyl-sn-glycerol-3-phosphate acyltransferase [Bacteroidales bacterium]|nr:1-acyl-sn-glycerol-3-phosphate acyltransferase [Bacteroidales bacterium]